MEPTGSYGNLEAEEAAVKAAAKAKGKAKARRSRKAIRVPRGTVGGKGW